VDHYGIVEGADLQSYIVIQAIVLIFVVILLVIAVRTIIKNICRQEDTRWLSTSDMPLDVVTGVVVLGVVQFTRLHPRLAGLTGTAFDALDDLWHTAILTSLLMLSFAGLRNWRFGDTWNSLRL
jgi:hypothetical protein